jgi:hypothetical protein
MGTSSSRATSTNNTLNNRATTTNTQARGSNMNNQQTPNNNNNTTNNQTTTNTTNTTPRRRSGSSGGGGILNTGGASGRSSTASNRHSVREVLSVILRGGSNRTSTHGAATGTAAGGSDGSISQATHSIGGAGSLSVEEGHNLWCIVKAKTRQHNSTRIITQKVWFEGKPNATLSIGRQENCDLRLEDDRCSPVNAKLISSPDGSMISLHAEGRMYRLIGIGNKTCNTTTVLTVGSVIKVGSVSLEVTALCTEQGENFMERFDSELRAVNAAAAAAAAATAAATATANNTDSGARIKSGSTSTPRGNNNTTTTIERNTASEANNGKSDINDGGVGASEGEDSGGENSHDDDGGSKIIDNVEDDAPAEICYICWGGPDDPLAPEELNAVRKKGERKSEVDKRLAESDGHNDKSPNPLIRNPCGKCSGSSRYVHLQCILTWIKSSGSGHCSICNGALPPHFSSPPPNIELKVVRHRRGQSWHGSRRFRLSFVDKDRVVIGRESESDVKLNDRSVDPRHASIIFDREKKQFLIKDLESTQGTYIQLTGTMDLSETESTYLKIGRTTLTLKLTHKRNSIIRNYLPSLGGSRG